MATTVIDQFAGSPSVVANDQITGRGETVAYKAPCRVGTIANIAPLGLMTIDGVVLAGGDRVLVRAQAAAAENGIYVASTGVWLRASDFDSYRDVAKGTRVTVTDGASLAGKEYQITSANPINVGADAISFVETLSSDAGSSATAAAVSAASALASKSDAETAAGNAATSAAAAQAAETNAETAETNAGIAASNATTSASNAATSATNAATSASGAAGSASAAQTAETNAEAAEAGAEAAQAAAEAAAGSVSFTKDNDGAMAANSNAVVPSQAAVVTYVAAAIAALRNGAAAAYDTLAEIATALTGHIANVANPHGVTAAQVGLGTAASPQFAGVNIGHATDTTLTRDAAGFISVEGKKVASPSGATAGDVTYFDGTQWVRLAKGTALQGLRMNAGATAPEWGNSGIFSVAYEGTPQTITSGGLITLAHGLGAEPKILQLLLQCVTAELGYTVGQRTPIGHHGQDAVAGGSRGVSVIWDATNLNLRFGSNASIMSLLNASSGNGGNITPANWRLIVRAYA